jgi:cobalt/nickel transport system permease protein
MHLIDRLAHTNRWTERHPGEKLLLGGGLLILGVVLPPLPGAILVLAAAAGAAVLGARTPVVDYCRILALPVAFLISSGLVLAVSVRLDGAGPAIAWSPAGAATAVEVSLRALAATASLLLMVLTTPLTDLLGLLRRVRVPAAIVDVTLLVYRFTMVIVDAAERGRVSQASRMGYSGFRRSLRSAGLLAAALLPRCLDRATRMESGLAARAYDGDLRVLPPSYAVSVRFLIGTSMLEGLIAAASLGWAAIDRGGL